MDNAPFSHVVFATDFSDNAAVAGREALRLAARWGAELTVVFVNTDLPLKRRWRKLENADAIESALRSAGLEKLEELVLAMQGDSGLKIGFVALEGKEPAAAITRFVEEQGADFLVGGSHGDRSLEVFSVGSVAIQLIRTASVPLLTVRPDKPTGFQKILAPVDFSPCSRASLELAIAVANQADDAELHVLHSFEALGFAALSVVSPGQEEDYRQQVLDAEQETLQGFLDDIDFGDVEPITEVVGRAPDQAILHYASTHDIDLICMGTVGRKGLSELLVGNTAERILRATTCSMLTTHPYDETE